MSDTTNSNYKPYLNICVKIADGRTTRIGPKIGVAFKHKDGHGLNIILDAQPIPLDGRIQLVAFETEE